MTSFKPIKLIVFALVVFWPGAVLSHPHDWIDVQSQFVINQAAQLTQINQRWRFDVYFSMMTYADLMNEHGDETLGLTRYAEQMVLNLSDYGYFSNLTIDGELHEMKVPSDYKLMLDKSSDPMILELDMIFDISSTQSLVHKSINWQVFDPTFYIAMIQEDETSITVITPDALKCEKTLQRPDPSDDVITYAQSLDKDQTDTLGLGINFAERAVIYCQ
jgi:ABC-type uncharacterized transport system substrate-binding protein